MTDLSRLRGSIPPLITPFANGKVDYERYKALIEFQIEQGTHGILVNGTTAEPSTSTLDERNRLVTLAMDTVAGRVPAGRAPIFWRRRIGMSSATDPGAGGVSISASGPAADPVVVDGLEVAGPAGLAGAK